MSGAKEEKQLSDLTIPAAQVEFQEEDRFWIAEQIQEVLSNGRLTLGKYGAAFEKNFAAFCGSQHAIAVNSGTGSLEIILRIMGIADRDVLLPTNTFFATAASLLHAGGRPVFVDIEQESLGIDPERLEQALTPNTAGIIVVHIGGVVSRRISDIQEFARRKGLWVVEDAAHAHGSSHNGVMAGNFGTAASFSFYPTKVMTCGEGGIILTNDTEIAEEARIFRDQGKAGFSQNAHIRLGYNWRLSEPHAIIGLKHLERLPSMISARQKAAAIYDESLRGSRNLRPLEMPLGSISNYYKYIVMLRNAIDRGQLKQKLRNSYSVSLSGEVYDIPLHKQPIFAEYAAGPLPVAEDLCERHICLPVFSNMEKRQIERVVYSLRQTLE